MDASRVSKLALELMFPPSALVGDYAFRQHRELWTSHGAVSRGHSVRHVAHRGQFPNSL
jgi:hypothetical protein